MVKATLLVPLLTGLVFSMSTVHTNTKQPVNEHDTSQSALEQQHTTSDRVDHLDPRISDNKDAERDIIDLGPPPVIYASEACPRSFRPNPDNHPHVTGACIRIDGHQNELGAYTVAVDSSIVGWEESLINGTSSHPEYPEPYMRCSNMVQHVANGGFSLWHKPENATNWQSVKKSMVLTASPLYNGIPYGDAQPVTCQQALASGHNPVAYGFTFIPAQDIPLTENHLFAFTMSQPYLNSPLPAPGHVSYGWTSTLYGHNIHNQSTTWEWRYCGYNEDGILMRPPTTCTETSWYAATEFPPYSLTGTWSAPVTFPAP